MLPFLFYKNHTSAKEVIIGLLSKMRPIACNSVPLQVLERLVLNNIDSIITRPNDPHQFEYKANRCTLDAIARFTYSMHSHLDKRHNAFNAVFLDCSNTLNTLSRKGLFDKFTATDLILVVKRFV